MTWTVRGGDILDETVDVLVCSANVMLNLSGGVGAGLLERYGNELQEHLHLQIADRTPRCAQRGEIFEMTHDKLPYRAVLHAVACDGFYETSVEIVRDLLRRCLEASARHAAETVAVTALGTGYGNLTLRQFGQAARPLVSENFSPIRSIVTCLMEDDSKLALERALAENSN